MYMQNMWLIRSRLRRRSWSMQIYDGLCIHSCWKAKLQDTVAFSTTESKYMVTVEASKEALWLRGFSRAQLASQGPYCAFYCARAFLHPGGLNTTHTRLSLGHGSDSTFNDLGHHPKRLAYVGLFVWHKSLQPLYPRPSPCLGNVGLFVCTNPNTCITLF